MRLHGSCRSRRCDSQRAAAAIPHGGGDGGGSSVPSYKDPYYLSPNDQPGLLITTVVFKDDNFAEWSRSVRLSLKAKRKITFLNGTEVKPIDDPAKMADWDVVQAYLVQWILNIVNPSLNIINFFMKCHNYP